MIPAWRRFAITPDGKLKALCSDYVYETTIATTVKPFSVLEWEEFEADVVGFCDRYGETRMLAMWKARMETESHFLRLTPFSHRNPQSFLCVSGFNAYKSEEHVRESYTHTPIIARVSLFGRVVEHERGYRAEKMRIDALEISPEIAKFKSTLEDRYQCEVTIWPTLERKSESERFLQQMSQHYRLGNPAMMWTLDPARDSPFVNVSAKKNWFQRRWERAKQISDGSLEALFYFMFGSF